MRSDAALWSACKEDAAQFCKDVKPGGGRMQACLVSCVTGLLAGRCHLLALRTHVCVCVYVGGEGDA
jgi:hypothetical protein